MKKGLTVFLTLLIISFAFGVFANGEPAEKHSHCVCGAADCTKNHEGTGVTAWQAWNGNINVGTATDTSVTAIYLYLENDVVLTDTFNITNVDVYFCLNGKTLSINKEGNPIVRVGKDRKLVLCDCKGTGKISGAKGAVQNDDNTCFGAINCQSGSNFVMYGGKIADNVVEKANGGGIYVNGGTFTMYGGVIDNNKAPDGSGGAVSVENGNIYTHGGDMTNNSAINGGAIHLKGSTNANVSDIKANGNTATNMGGAIFTEVSVPIEINRVEFGNNNAKNGGAVYINSVKDNVNNNVYANMRNIDVHNNSATSNGGGVYLDGNGKSNPTISIYDSEICNNTSNASNTSGSDGSGGGIFGTAGVMLNLFGGNVSNNTCSDNGGGICMVDDSYLMSAKRSDVDSMLNVKGNKAKNGGGIYTDANMLYLIGKSEIEGNTATEQGGGVHIFGYYERIAFQNLKVTGNTAKTGGGVYLNKDNSRGELEIFSSTSIIGNTSSAGGAASNLYLNNGRMFQFCTGLTGSERIGVSVSKTPTLDDPTSITYKGERPWSNGGDYSSLIIPDNNNYKVIYDSETYMHKLVPCSETVLAVTKSKISVSNPNKAAVLIAASYDGNRLLDIKRMLLSGSESTVEYDVSDIKLKTEGATKITAFLWDNSNGNGGINHPLCESQTAEF